MTGIHLLQIPAGQVELHDARRGRRWNVHLDSFLIGQFPVTVAQYLEITLSEKSAVEAPIANIAWIDAVMLCNRASVIQGLAEAYIIDGTKVTWRIEADGYRLPTEAEWEYACRAGTTGPHYAPLDVAGWTAGDEVDAPQAVGLKQANNFGLHDTLGNVWEWCWDHLDPARYGDYRVFKGGGFADKKWSARASTRRGGAPGMSHPDVGFRFARGAYTPRELVQGWSAEADAERGAMSGKLPSGWTPRGAA